VRQSGPNRDAVGARIEVRAGDRTISREVTVGGGHVSGSLGWIHFGIGAADEASVKVTWPDGESEEALSVSADTWSIIERGTGRAEPWQPGS
ncbi:MAG TPA: ASPIC/UnbV domain-containing protein, partial [Candidatus Limnocylindria bacterium]